MLVTPMGLLFEFVSAGGGCVDESLSDILVSGTAEEMMSYMLTPKEQEVLYHAYFRGYYSQPRDPLPASLGGFTPPRAVCRFSARMRTPHLPIGFPILGASHFQTAGARLPGE
jgi:hypothetical protein